VTRVFKQLSRLQQGQLVNSISMRKPMRSSARDVTKILLQIGRMSLGGLRQVGLFRLVYQRSDSVASLRNCPEALTGDYGGPL